MPINHHFHDCTALLVWRFIVVKWRYIKYEALPFLPEVTFLAIQPHRPLASTKLYCLVTEAHVCEQLVRSHYMIVEATTS